MEADLPPLELIPQDGVFDYGKKLEEAKKGLIPVKSLSRYQQWYVEYNGFAAEHGFTEVCIFYIFFYMCIYIDV